MIRCRCVAGSLFHRYSLVQGILGPDPTASRFIADPLPQVNGCNGTGDVLHIDNGAVDTRAQDDQPKIAAYRTGRN